MAHERPVEQQGRMRIGLQLAALAAVQMGVEHETACIEVLQQHGARRRPRIERGGGDGHRGPIRLSGGERRIEQFREGGDGFGVQDMISHRHIVARRPRPCTHAPGYENGGDFPPFRGLEPMPLTAPGNSRAGSPATR
jgi:hypothetical protein